VKKIIEGLGYRIVCDGDYLYVYLQERFIGLIKRDNEAMPWKSPTGETLTPINVNGLLMELGRGGK